MRGGGELGPTWWEDGRLLAKRNTFTDFIACAETLIAGGYTSSERLAISGGSAGGLLIGAVINERPDLACAAIASVPFVDVSNSMLDPTLRMTSTEYEEWGDPSDREQFAYMDGYCPYGNVRGQGYPHLLITCGLHDTRVHFWGPAKWAARLRQARTDDRLQLLKSQLAAGHFGPSDLYAVARETAFQYAFLLEVLGVADRGGPSYPPRVDAGM